MNYPFSALLGQEQLKTALLLNAVDPGIGGVLVCGEKGTAKSTAARALADLLPPIMVRRGCPCNSAPHDPPLAWAGAPSKHLAHVSEPRGLSPREHVHCDSFPSQPFGGEHAAGSQRQETFAPAPAGIDPAARQDCVDTDRQREREIDQREAETESRFPADASVIEVPAPFVDLPLGATEDRVIGTLDFERALRDGKKAFQPGLLAAANRGVLYVDEVNLLADHLVDALLDAAASGVNIVQREGIEIVHPARFLLIGTMNPEEGRLRPQLLDRFGLMVEVTGPIDVEDRVEIVRRRIAFDHDPADFAASWEEAQHSLRQRIAAARQLLPRVDVSDEMLILISQTCSDSGVDGMRGDIVVYRTSRALAALEARSAVTADDVARAAELGLLHRRRRRDVGATATDRRHPDELPPPSDGPDEGNGAPAETNSEKVGTDTSPANQSEDGETAPEGSPDRAPGEITFPARASSPVRPLRIASAASVEGRMPGRRNRSAPSGQGQYRRAVPDAAPDRLAVDATIRAAALRGHPGNGPINVRRSDLHRKECVGQSGTTILFVVDSSGSMAARQRMQAVKGAVIGLLQDAYIQRDQVGVIAFRGAQAELVLSPTGSVELAERALESLPTGGRTPLAHALSLASETIDRIRRSNPKTPVLLVLLTDGRANVALPGREGDAWRQSLEAAAELAAGEVPALVLDTDGGFVRLGRTQTLAQALAAEYLSLDELTAGTLTVEIGQRRRSAATVSRPTGECP